jgi:signal transduction histidine kinase
VTDAVGQAARADAAIAEYGVLEEPGARDLKALVELAALFCEVPNAAINLITSEHQRQVATAGIDPSVCAREDSMCAAVLDDRSVVVASDASKDPRFETNPFVTGVIDSVKFYASAPLVTPEGTTIGRLCVFDSEPHELSTAKAGALEVVAARIVDVLELRLRTRQLEHSVDELTRTKDELDRSNERLSLFAGQVSHDLRTPLTAVMANAELLTTEPVVAGDPAVSQMVNGALDASRRMATMIETILAYTRVGAALELVDVSLDDLMEGLVSDLDLVIKERHAQVSYADLPVLRADREQLYAVLLNLVSNALKFAPPTRTPVVAVRATRVGEEWRITVTDNGRGVPADHRDSVFELYTRGDRSVDGSGIGLATARRAVEAHGGHIGIEDAPGGGTTVWFTLPTNPLPGG